MEDCVSTTASPGHLMRRVQAILDPSNCGAMTDAQRRYFQTTSIQLDKLGLTGIERDNPAVGLVSHVGNFWRHGILMILRTGRYRPSQIAKLLSALDPSRPISQRMLCLNLRVLQRDGLISKRIVEQRLNNVEYELTPLGEKFVVRFVALIEWIGENAFDVEQARQSFDRLDGN